MKCTASASLTHTRVGTRTEDEVLHDQMTFFPEVPSPSMPRNTKSVEVETFNLKHLSLQCLHGIFKIILW